MADKKKTLEAIEHLDSVLASEIKKEQERKKGVPVSSADFHSHTTEEVDLGQIKSGLLRLKAKILLTNAD